MTANRAKSATAVALLVFLIPLASDAGGRGGFSGRGGFRSSGGFDLHNDGSASRSSTGPAGTSRTTTATNTGNGYNRTTTATNGNYSRTSSGGASSNGNYYHSSSGSNGYGSHNSSTNGNVYSGNYSHNGSAAIRTARTTPRGAETPITARIVVLRTGRTSTARRIIQTPTSTTDTSITARSWRTPSTVAIRHGGGTAAPAWYAAPYYYGGGFWGAYAIGVTSAAVYGSIVAANNATIESYQVAPESPGAKLLASYQLTQTPCGPPNLVVIYGPNSSVICAHPNSLVSAGNYSVNSSNLTITSQNPAS